MAFPPYGVSVPTLNPWQLSFGGLVMGNGTPYLFSKITGLDMGTIRAGDVPRPRSHGELAGLDFAGGKDIILDGDASSDGTSLQHALMAVAGPMAPQGGTEQPLWIQIANLPLLASMVRPRQNPTTIDFPFAAGLANKVLHFHSTDHRLYAAPQQSSVGLGTPLGGLRFPVTFPATFGGGTVAGIITANNAGNVDMNPVLVITGPCTNPSVVNATTGWSLSFSNPFSGGFTLNSGDTLTVDLDLHTVTYVANGTTVGQSRTNWLVPGSIWPNPITPIYGLAVGSNTIQFTSSDSGAVAGTLAVQWASAYLI